MTFFGRELPPVFESITAGVGWLLVGDWLFCNSHQNLEHFLDSDWFIVHDEPFCPSGRQLSYKKNHLFSKSWNEYSSKLLL